MTPPSRRVDVTIPADLIEELVRTLGYDSTPTTMISTPIPSQRLSGPERDWEEIIRDTLVAAGYAEVILYPLTNASSQGKMRRASAAEASTLPEDLVQRLLNLDIEPLRLANPMTEELSILRTTAFPGVLETTGS